MEVYAIEHEETYWECRVEIDPDKAKEAIKECVEFWSSYENRLRINDGNYTKTFLKQLAIEIHTEVVGNNYNTYGVTEAFKNKEGWLPLDGTEGVRLLTVDESTFEDEQYSINKIK